MTEQMGYEEFEIYAQVIARDYGSNSEAVMTFALAACGLEIYPTMRDCLNGAIAVLTHGDDDGTVDYLATAPDARWIGRAAVPGTDPEGYVGRHRDRADVLDELHRNGVRHPGAGDVSPDA